jgi:hypothetical protein
MMNGKQKVSAANGLRRFIEANPLVTLCAVAISITGTVFGALNWLYSSKLGVEVENIKIEYKRSEDELKKQYSDKIKGLDEERSRIQFAVKDQSSFLDLKTLIVSEERLGAEYKKFKVGFAGFAVPSSASATVAWAWRETNQLDMIGEMLGQTFLSEFFSDPQLKEVFRRGIVHSFESPTLVEVDASAGKMKLKARCFFQAITKAELDFIFAATETKKKDPKLTLVTHDMDFYYFMLFRGAFEGLHWLGDSVSIDEVGLNRDHFVVKAKADLPGPSGTSVRVYFLSICIRLDGRFYVAGYLIPAGEDLQDVKTSMSMISGFKILK